MIINGLNLTTALGWRTLEVMRPGIGQEAIIEPTSRRLGGSSGYNTVMLVNGRRTPPGRLVVRGHVIGATAAEAMTRTFGVLSVARGLPTNGIARISLPGHTLDADWIGYLDASGTEVTGAVARRNTRAYAVTLSFLLPDARRFGLTSSLFSPGPQTSGALFNSVGPVPLTVSIEQGELPGHSLETPRNGVQVEIRNAAGTALRRFTWRRWPALPSLGLAQGPGGTVVINARTGQVTAGGLPA